MGYIAVVDYDVGNLMSVNNAMHYLGFETKVTAEPEELERADAMILPGVGAFPDAAEKLVRSGMLQALRRQAQQKPILGICLGMQLLFDTGVEVRETDGLALVPGRVERIETNLKLPHIGWNSLNIVNPDPLTAGLSDGDYVYFVHSFCAKVKNSEDLALTTDYGTTVTAMIARGNVFGCQFHPEKSGPVGMTILKNFGELTK